jgi:hypothetical protein
MAFYRGKLYLNDEIFSQFDASKYETLFANFFMPTGGGAYREGLHGGYALTSLQLKSEDYNPDYEFGGWGFSNDHFTVLGYTISSLEENFYGHVTVYGQNRDTNRGTVEYTELATLDYTLEVDQTSDILYHSVNYRSTDGSRTVHDELVYEASWGIVENSEDNIEESEGGLFLYKIDVEQIQNFFAFPSTLTDWSIRLSDRDDLLEISLQQQSITVDGETRTDAFDTLAIFSTDSQLHITEITSQAYSVKSKIYSAFDKQEIFDPNGALEDASYVLYGDDVAVAFDKSGERKFTTLEAFGTEMEIRPEHAVDEEADHSGYYVDGYRTVKGKVTSIKIREGNDFYAEEQWVHFDTPIVLFEDNPDLIFDYEVVIPTADVL